MKKWPTSKHPLLFNFYFLLFTSCSQQSQPPTVREQLAHPSQSPGASQPADNQKSKIENQKSPSTPIPTINAALRKIAQTRLSITDAMLHAEYYRVHGEKAEVRHIQLDAPRSWPDIRARLENGERFEEMVILFSQNPISRHKLGLLAPFTRMD